MKNVPKLRFKGFSDEWKDRTLGGIADITKLAGFEFTEYVQYSDSGSIIALRGLNVKNGRLNLNDVKYIDNSDFSKLNRSKLFMNDLLFTYVGTIGDVALVDEDNKYYLAPNVCRIRIEDENSYFIKTLMSSSKFYNKIILPSVTTSSQPALSMENIRLFKINIPTIKEQEKIANFLTKIDKLIEKQEEKVSNLEQYKKGMMQKIFSQEIRFKKDDGGEYPEWKKEHLGNIVERVVRKNKGNITKRPLTISAQYGLVDQEEFFNKVVASANLEGYYLLNKGEFAYNKSYSNGYPFGAIKRLDRYGNGAVSTLYICFMPKEKFSSDYLVQYFESDMWHKEVSMVAVEGARNHGLLNISVSDFFETIHKVPCLEEQIKIANFLSKIDLTVEKEKEKLEELRCWKKGLLQKLFV